MTDLDFWNDAHSKSSIRMRLPSRWNVSVSDTQRLLRKYVRPGMHVLEVGCAPGKTLAWTAKVLRADVAGIDYSRPGIEKARALFSGLNIEGDLRCEDFFNTDFERAFDVVYSLGVIEHFEDPRPIVRRHVQSLRPGGVALMSIPNLAPDSIYGLLQRKIDPDIVDIHNTSIMSAETLRDLAPTDLSSRVRTFAFGRMSPWMINWRKRLPASAGFAILAAANIGGLLQPIAIDYLSPWLVLEIQRK